MVASPFLKESQKEWSDILAGLIICGYPGVGKSSIGGWYNCIDLESSYFSKGWDGSMVNILQEPLNYVKTSLEDEVKTLRIPSWVSCYADVGMDLADQGYTVLMSTHKDVLDFLEAASKAQETYGDEPIRPVIFSSLDISTIDESPMAYKPMDEIIKNISETVEIERIIKPIYNFKAGE